MDIEIEVLGKSNKWVVNQSRIRIGRGPNCEVSLPSWQFPTVEAEHVELDVLNGTVKIAVGATAHGEVYLNDHPAGPGSVLLSGDVLRLGADGPDLRLRFSERAASLAPGGYEPTRVMDGSTPPGREPTQVMAGPSIGAPPPRAPQAAAPSRPPTQQSPAPPPAARPVMQPAAPLPPPPAIRQRRTVDAEEVDDAIRRLQGKLTLMQIAQVANLAIVVALLVWVFQLKGQLAENSDTVRALQAQAQGAIGQFTPALDARLGVFEKRMDGLDGKLRAAEDHMEAGLDTKMKAAQDQLFTSLDAKMKSTEDRLVTRMNSELPAMLDKYLNAKLAEVKH